MSTFDHPDNSTHIGDNMAAQTPADDRSAQPTQSYRSTQPGEPAPSGVAAKALSVLFKVTLLIFLAGGAVVTFGQIAAVLFGNGSMVVLLASRVGDPACVVAGVCGLFAFLGLYVKKAPSLE